MKKIFFLAVCLTLISTQAFAAFVIGDGRKRTDYAGTVMPLSSSDQLASSVTICAFHGNKGRIFVGTDPVSTLNSEEGLVLHASRDQCTTLATVSPRMAFNLANINIVSSTSYDEGVTYTYILEKE